MCVETFLYTYIFSSLFPNTLARDHYRAAKTQQTGSMWFYVLSLLIKKKILILVALPKVLNCLGSLDYFNFLLGSFLAFENLICTAYAKIAIFFFSENCLKVSFLIPFYSLITQWQIFYFYRSLWNRATETK